MVKCVVRCGAVWGGTDDAGVVVWIYIVVSSC
jgi:hypothetical protein